MQHTKELGQLLRECEREGIEVPTAVWWNKYDFDNYSDSVTAELAVYKNSTTFESIFVSIIVTYTFGESFSLKEILKGKNPLDVHELKIAYSSISEDDDCHPVEPKDWHTLPRMFKEEASLIDRLDQSMPSDENSKVVRKQRAGPNMMRWDDFFSQLVIAGNLRWTRVNGDEFPYVITTSETLYNVGRSEGGLYFVATDIAREPWQEMVVAYHERFCQRKGHKFALRRERELARTLGKEQEYKLWRKQIKLDHQNGKYH